MKTNTIRWPQLLLLTTLVCLLAPLKFYGYGVPVTLQTFMLFSAAALLKPFEAMIMVFTYVFLGGIGLPVFAEYQGGWEKLTGPTAGFLWGFIPVSFYVSWVFHRYRPAYYFGILHFFITHFLLLIPGFLILKLQMPEVALYPTFAKLLPGLILKSFLGGLISVALKKTPVFANGRSSN